MSYVPQYLSQLKPFVKDLPRKLLQTPFKPCPLILCCAALILCCVAFPLFALHCVVSYTVVCGVVWCWCGVVLVLSCLVFGVWVVLSCLELSSTGFVLSCLGFALSLSFSRLVLLVLLVLSNILGLFCLILSCLLLILSLVLSCLSWCPPPPSYRSWSCLGVYLSCFVLVFSVMALS
jgi:hypothetical protein